MATKITFEKLARMIQKGFKEAKTDAFEIKKELKSDIKGLEGDIKGLEADVKILKTDVKELKLTTQRIETRQEAEALRHDRHSVIITDHEKRIKTLEKV